MTTRETTRPGLAIRILWIAVPLALAAGVAAALLWPRTTVFYSDGTRVWPDRPDLGLRTVLWEPGGRIAGLGQEAEDYDPCLSGDGQELYFTRGRAGRGADLYVAYRALEGWGRPRPLVPLNTPADEIGPALAPDGATLYFYSDRPGGEGGYDLYVARHTPDGWAAPVNLGPAVNSPFNEYDPALTPDGRRLLFASNRPVPGKGPPLDDAWRATLREKPYLNDYDIYALDLGEAGEPPARAAPRRLEALASPANDGQPAVSPDGRWLYFASDRAGGLGGYDLYRSRISAPPLADLLPPENLGPPVNTPRHELDPAVSLEGFGLYFSSDRAKPDTYALYYARSHEVYPVVRTQRLDLGEVVGRLSWPLLGLILALAGLAVALLALARFRRRPGLLSGALLVSLVLHLVGLSLMTVWHLSAAVSELLQKEERFEVTVHIPGLAESEVSGALKAALAELTRADRRDLDLAKVQAAALPSPPEPPKPLPVLAMAEPRPRPLEVAPLPDRPPDLSDPLLAPPEPAPPVDPLPPAPMPPLRQREVRPAERTEPLAPREVALARHEPSAEAPPVARPAPSLPPVAVGPEPTPAPLRQPPILPETAPLLVDLRTAEIVPVPQVVDLAPTPVEAVQRPVTPAPQREPADRRQGLASERPPRPDPPMPAAPARVGPPEADRRLPAAETLLAMAPPAAPPPTAPRIEEGVRPVALPPPAPVEADVSPPPAPLPPKEVYRLRTQPDRQGLIEQLGGTPETEKAVRQALVWLARHQSADGRWDIDGFPSNYSEGGRRADGAGQRSRHDVGVTGLAALAFVGAGHTHLPARGAAATGPHADAVRKALDWLVAGQRADGDLRRDGQLYDHAIALMTLAESYSMTGDPRLAEPVRRGVQFLADAQTPDFAWRYEPRKDSDTSVVGWTVMALKSTEIAGFPIPPKCYRGAANWLDKVRQGKRGGLYVYQPGREVSPSMTAEGLFTEFLVGGPPAEPRLAETLEYLSAHPPRWLRKPVETENLYYWYYATMALHQTGGEAWDRWNVQIRQTLVQAQRQDGPFAGSWDPQTRWDQYAGRVYTTALGALTLEVYYRYLPFYALRREGDAPPPAAPAIPPAAPPAEERSGSPRRGGKSR